MCYTTNGNELTRITVIDTSGKIVYEQLVKPENPIIDYNTRWGSELREIETILFVYGIGIVMVSNFCVYFWCDISCF